MAKMSHRVFALSLAILFFATAFAFSFLVIWQLATSHSNNNSDSSSQTPAATTTTPKPTAGKLAGTKLAGFTPVAHISKLEAIDTKVGTGATVQPGATVVVDYTGAIASTGIIFQSSLDTGQPATLSLSQVIAGWSQGIPGMKVGGTRRLLIPAALAYGANPPSGSNIPANADLVFDITLHSISGS